MGWGQASLGAGAVLFALLLVGAAAWRRALVPAVLAAVGGILAGPGFLALHAVHVFIGTRDCGDPYNPQLSPNGERARDPAVLRPLFECYERQHHHLIEGWVCLGAGWALLFGVLVVGSLRRASRLREAADA